MIGLGTPKKPKNDPTEADSLNSTPMPSGLQGEAPNPPRRKKPRVDSGGQLGRGAMRAA